MKTYYKAPLDWDNQKLMTILEWELEIPLREEEAKKTQYYCEGEGNWEDQRKWLFDELFTKGFEYCFENEPNFYIFKIPGLIFKNFSENLEEATNSFEQYCETRKYESVEIRDRFNNKLYTLGE